MVNLIRLDLSFNNIVKLSPKISDLKNLQQLWLNDNPLREIPVEICKLHKLKELDLKNTFVITLPRELANLTSLLSLNLDGCPMKETLSNTYTGGMTSIHTDLRRKEDRKLYKEKIFDTLTEWIYPSENKEEVFERVEQLFGVLKDCNTEMLKKLHRNCQMLFPVKFRDIDPMVIREKLFKLYDEGIAREDIAKIELRLKSHFLDEPLEVIVKLATDIFNNIKDQNTIDVNLLRNNSFQDFFRYKSHIFTEQLAALNSDKLLQNLANYRSFKRQERIETIEFLKNQIDNLYSDEKIKEERLREYTDSLVKELKRTSMILQFAKTLQKYMPKYNELKHFNAKNIAQAFYGSENNQTTGASNTMTFY